MSIRAFIAIELDEPVRRGLADLQEDLERSGADVKWVKPANLHLTVKFLGQVEDETVRRVNEIMEKAVEGVAPFGLRIAGAGSFPRGRRPRVVWVAAHEVGSALEAIHRRLEKGLASVGVAPDGRRFVAHVTLGRVRSGRRAERLADGIDRAADREFGEVTVNALTLFESTLTPTGPIYGSIGRASLGREGGQTPSAGA